jgi:hypothetical protein
MLGELVAGERCGKLRPEGSQGSRFGAGCGGEAEERGSGPRHQISHACCCLG